MCEVSTQNFTDFFIYDASEGVFLHVFAFFRGRLAAKIIIASRKHNLGRCGFYSCLRVLFRVIFDRIPRMELSLQTEVQILERLATELGQTDDASPPIPAGATSHDGCTGLEKG